MHRCHLQELLRSFALLLGMSYSYIRLLCQFRFVYVQNLNGSLFHIMPCDLYLKQITGIQVLVLYFMHY